MTNCLILTCRASQTREILAQAKELHPGKVWAPIIVRYRRLPRSRKRVRFFAAALPGYLFVHAPGADVVYDLRRKARVLYDAAGISPAYCTIESLRAMQELIVASEQPATTEAVAPTFVAGQMVQVLPGNHFLSGVFGMVLSVNGEEICVDTGGFWRKLKISAWLLRPAALI